MRRSPTATAESGLILAFHDVRGGTHVGARETESLQGLEGFTEGDRAYLAGLLTRRVYAPGEWLFHESTPRLWYGIVASGEVELQVGLHGSAKRIGSVTAEAADQILVEEGPHIASAFTRAGSTVLPLDKPGVEREYETGRTWSSSTPSWRA